MNLSTVNVFKHIKSDKCISITDEQLHKLQTVTLEILLDIDECCKNNNITYTLGGGSALGAIRHKGFIPWDDDIDINMSRPDYNRFVKCFKEKYLDRYWLHTPEETDNYGLLLARVLKKGTVVKTREDFFNEECGAFVDIFIMENVPNNKVLRALHGFGSLVFGFILSCRKFYRDRKFLLPLVEDDNSLKRVFKYKIAIGFIFSFASINFWTRTAAKWNANCKNNESEFVSGCAGKAHYFGEIYRRDAVCKSKYVMFEGNELPVPAEAESYLVQCYGDWEAIPSDENKEAHVYFGLSI